MPDNAQGPANVSLPAIRVLGSVRISAHGQDSIALRPAQGRLLAILCLAPAAGLDIDTLTDRMWGEDPPRTARTTLQMHVSALRRKAPGLIITTAEGYRLARGPEDLELVGRLVVEAGAAAEQGDWARVMEATHEALAGWNGESFADYSSELWAIGEVRRIEITYNHLVDMRLKALLALGSNDEAVELARFDLGRDALDEARWYQLIVGLHRAGRPSEALRAFREADQIIRQEVGIPPGVALRALEHRIRLDEPGLHEIGAGAATHNLPEASTTFVGRSADLAAIEAMLRTQRAVTIVGPPGVGKTRLAVEIGRMSLDRYPDGVWFSSLAPARSDADVLSIVTLSTRTRQNSATVEQLAGMLAMRRILLVLDNCEHVPESSRRLVSALIDAPGGGAGHKSSAAACHRQRNVGRRAAGSAGDSAPPVDGGRDPGQPIDPAVCRSRPCGRSKLPPRA